MSFIYWNKEKWRIPDNKGDTSKLKDQLKIGCVLKLETREDMGMNELVKGARR